MQLTFDLRSAADELPRDERDEGFRSSVFVRPRRELACNETVIPAWKQKQEQGPDEAARFLELRLDPGGSTKSSEVKQMLMLIQIVAPVAGKLLWKLDF